MEFKMELDEFIISIGIAKKKLNDGTFMKEGIRQIKLHAKITIPVKRFKKGELPVGAAFVKYNKYSILKIQTNKKLLNLNKRNTDQDQSVFIFVTFGCK